MSFHWGKNNLWDIQTMKYYLMILKSETSSHEKICKNLKWILLSERDQSNRATYCII